jgi:type I restriction enzyme S subunit
MAVENLITEHLDIWTSAIKTKSAAGRGSSKKLELVGIKKLRELILELAVRGKLVSQDPNDEPASELLNKVATEKARLVLKEGLKTKAADIIEGDDCYLEVPYNWDWCRLGNLSKFIDYRGKTPKKVESGVRLITAKNVRKGYIDLNPEEFITETEYKLWMTRGFPRISDILFTPEAPLGNVAIIKLTEKFALAQRAICLQLHVHKMSEFMQLAMMCKSFQQQLFLNATGMTATGIKASKLKEIPVPIPPLNEQHQIVAKVDELMALCDQLEAQTEASIDAHKTLVEVLLATLTDAKDADELNDNWQTISQHFDVLFTTQASIDQLKQTILQLAVMGKLVKQDPKDEPASKLLERIATEKQQLIKDGKIKKQKPLPPITNEEKPFALPDGWEFERFGNLTSRLGSGSTPRGGQSAYVEEGVIFLRSQNVWNDGLKLDDTAYISDVTNEKMNNTQVFPGDVLLNITGASLGRSTIFPEHLKIANVSQHVTIIRLIGESMGLFVHLGILSPLVQRLVWGRQVGMAIEGLSKKVLELFEFPVPPLAEQHRIVAKVDELMILCDSLKANLNQAQTTQLQLTDAIVEQAL